MIRVEAQVTSEQLLKAVEQMPQQELEFFITQVLQIRAQREIPHLSAVESELLLKIGQGINGELQQRFDELVTKQKDFILTEADHQELVQVTEQIEQSDVDRVELLGKLAQLWNKSLTETMQELGIQPPACV